MWCLTSLSLVWVVHPRRSFPFTTTHTTDHAFPALSPEDKRPPKSDVTLLRRKEISRIGRFLRSNGMGNEGNALTMLLK